MSGIRAELVVESPAGCPVAAASTDGTGPNTGVTWTQGNDGTVTEQFTAASDGDVGDARQVFDYGDRAVYEFERSADEPCACATVERRTGPIRSVHSRDGNLHLSMIVSDVEELRRAVQDLRDAGGDVRIEYLVRGRAEDDESAVVPVDLARLTERQQEVIETAHDMGYFDYPRESNAQAVSRALDIQPSTFAEHLAAAQSKLLDEVTAHG